MLTLFQIDKNDENKNLRMNEINCKQVNHFNLIDLNESLFLLNGVFQLINFIFSSDWFCSTWGIQSNHQRDESESSIWLISSFLSVEKIIFSQMNYQYQWNDNWFIIEFSFNFYLEWIIWIENLYHVEYTYFYPNNAEKIIRVCFSNWLLEWNNLPFKCLLKSNGWFNSWWKWNFNHIEKTIYVEWIIWIKSAIFFHLMKEILNHFEEYLNDCISS